MIQRLSHTSVYVLDQDEAKDFYTKKLGFEVREDVTLGSFRWLTVGAKGQDLNIVLMAIGSGPAKADDEVVARLRTLVQSGTIGGGVFETDDCKATYARLSAAGVEFTSEPAERPYGTEAVFRDNSGNHFSLVERPRAARNK